MADLVEFYLARLDERARAEEAHTADCGETARVLRDVAAKRAIVEQCAGVLAEFDRRDTWGAWPDFGLKHLAEDVLAQLAEVYTDHPDYREEWRP